ncbi:hypothetical protein BSBH6_03552 [Bacillus subtilis]|nr:hypothetical protein BSBH6_03552 [Bacillus subtilis]RPK22291.1 hypothetical protein BH5_03556 [Bacillus subtilis]
MKNMHSLQLRTDVMEIYMPQKTKQKLEYSLEKLEDFPLILRDRMMAEQF